MGRFVQGSDLNNELVNLVRDARRYLLFVSPYVRLHECIKEELSILSRKKSVTLMLLFGKNKIDLSRSLSREDIKFIQQFPNVDIRYRETLHAKYYGNESTSILTSMNLYDYSMDNNIESGTVHDNRFEFRQGPGIAACRYFHLLFESSEPIYSHRLDVVSSFGGLRKRYGGVRIHSDNIIQNYSSDYQPANAQRHQDSPPPPTMGYCIRTGQVIPFNLSRPLCQEAYNNWKYYGDPVYPEKYCHYSGEPSDGKTSYGRPVLWKYWNFVRGFA